MKIDIYNSERYYDPTPYAALTSILNQEEAALRAAAPGGDGFRPVIYAALIQEILKRMYVTQDGIAVLRWKTGLFRLHRICYIRSS